MAGNSSCSQCPIGMESKDQSSECTFCPIGHYNALTGSVCLQCEQGKTTAGPGSTSVDQCVSPQSNLGFGLATLFALCLFLCPAVFWNTFRKVSRNHYHHIIKPLDEKLSTAFAYLANDVKYWKSSSYKILKVLGFLCLGCLLVVAVVLPYVIDKFSIILYTLVILWQNLHVIFPHLHPPEQLFELVSKALEQIVILSPVRKVLQALVMIFASLYKLIMSIPISFSMISVNCSGSEAPLELFLNCIILSLVILFLETKHEFLLIQLQQFCLQSFSKMSCCGKLRNLLLYLVVSLNPFKYALRFCLGLTIIRPFIFYHETSPKCDGVKELPYFDSGIGYFTSCLFWLIGFPVAYILIQIIIPRNYECSSQSSERKPLSFYAECCKAPFIYPFFTLLHSWIDDLLETWNSSKVNLDDDIELSKSGNNSNSNTNDNNRSIYKGIQVGNSILVRDCFTSKYSGKVYINGENVRLNNWIPVILDQSLYISLVGILLLMFGLILKKKLVKLLL